jgi:hypothetical protein
MMAAQGLPGRVASKGEATMEGMQDASAARGRAPWHLWVVGGLALLWYVSGAVTIQLAQLGQLPGLDAGELAYYAAKPAWKVALTAVSTYGSVLAALLLLMRRKASVALFALMLAAILLGNAVELADGTSRAYANNAAAIATAVIVAIAVFMVWYARAMQRRGVLR